MTQARNPNRADVENLKLQCFLVTLFILLEFAGFSLFFLYWT